MKGIITLLLLSLSDVAVNADKVVNSTSPPPAEKPATECGCECTLEKNKCADFKKTLPEAEQRKVITCKESDQDLLKEYQSAGCFHGVLDATILALLNLPFTVGGIIQDDMACNADPAAKLMLLRKVYQGYEPAMLKIMIEKWNCGDIKREVDNREQAYFKTIHDKKIKIKTEMEGRGQQPTEAELQTLVEKSLTPNELAFSKAVGPQEDPAARMIAKYGNSWNCFTRYERMRLICDDVTTGLAAVAAVAGISRAAAKGVAKAANATPKPIYKGKAYEFLSDGYWMNYYGGRVPHGVESQLTRLPRNYSISGGEIVYRNPFRGADSMLVHMDRNYPTVYRIFTGWGGASAETQRLQQIGRELGLDVSDAFIGTRDAFKMEQFLRRVNPQN